MGLFPAAATVRACPYPAWRGPLPEATTTEFDLPAGGSRLEGKLECARWAAVGPQVASKTTKNSFRRILGAWSLRRLGETCQSSTILRPL